MKQYLKNKFQVTDDGAKGLVKAITATFFVYAVSMFPIMLMMLAGDMFVLGNYHSKYSYAVFAFIALVLLYISLWMEYERMFNATYRESANLRINIAEKLKDLPISYFSKNNLSDLAQSIMADVEAVEHAMSHAIPKVYGLYLFLPVLGFILIAGNYKLGLAVIVPNLLRFAVMHLYKKETDKGNSRFYRILRKNSEDFQEMIEMNREIKGFCRTDEVEKKLYKQMEYSEKTHLKSEITTMKVLVVSTVFAYISLGLVLLIGSKLMLNNEVDILYLIGYIMASIKVKEIIDISSENFLEILYIAPRVERIKEINSQIVQNGESAEFDSFDISLEDVEFSYDNGIKVIDGVSFCAKQGEVTALVGESGCGKSTLLKLISRLYDYDRGEISIDGKVINEISTDSLFKNISVVFQDVTLFNTSVMENIRIGRIDASDEEVMESAELANCMDFIEKLPEGFNSQIGENGAELSGGERQRLSIARAFLKKAPILILDEISANLDIENERKIQQSLNNLIKDRTVIVISHRLKSIQNADKIVVIDKGRVESQGSHEELMKTSKIYRRLNVNNKRAEEFIY